MRWFDRRFATHTSGHKFDIYSVNAHSMILDKLKCYGLVQWTTLDAPFAGHASFHEMSLSTTYVVSLGALATDRTDPTLLARQNGKQNAKRILFKWHLWFSIWMKYHRNWCSKQSNEIQITFTCICESWCGAGRLKQKPEYIIRKPFVKQLCLSQSEDLFIQITHLKNRLMHIRSYTHLQYNDSLFKS